MRRRTNLFLQKGKFQLPIQTKTMTITESLDVSTENVIKTMGNHSLILLRRPRTKGQCVECLRKRKSDPKLSRTLPKITTYCITCPGGNWMCEQCFDDMHKGN